MSSRVPSKSNSLFILNERSYGHYWFSPQYNLTHSFNEYIFIETYHMAALFNVLQILWCITLFSFHYHLDGMKTSNKTDKQVNKNTSNTNECYNEIKEGGIIRVVDGTFFPNSVLGKTTLWR